MAETIAAVATPAGEGSIGVIRISGDHAVEIAARVFCASSGRPLAGARGYTALHGMVRRPDTGEAVDEAIALVFRAPRSYTGEDVVELSCHGGQAVTRGVLRSVLDAGAVPAQAGEFTKRAFLNGKMDLAQAESVMQIISAQGQAAAQAALGTLGGRLSRDIDAIREQLLALSAHLAAFADYPEDEIPELREDQVERTLSQVDGALETLLRRFDTGKLIREGVATVIAGRPNVGKSALMNLLSGEERSIVTDIAGTTRDIVEETIQVAGVTLRLADTAGLRDTADPVERIGVDRARGRLEAAQLILAVFDRSRALDEEDYRLLDFCAGRTAVAVVNKSDLEAAIDLAPIRERMPLCVEICARDGTGVEELERAVGQALGTAGFDTGAPLLISDRQRDCCIRARTAVREALDALAAGVTLDAVTVCTQDALAALLELTGERAGEAVVEEVFSKFCVGK